METRRTELNVTIHAQENIVAFNVTMDDTVSMEMLESLGCLARDGRNLAFRHKVGGDDVRERASLHVFHDNPEFVLVEERVDVVDDVGVARRAHDKNLVDDEILLGLLLEVHLLNRDGHVSAHLVRRVHASGRSATHQRQTSLPHDMIS